MAPIRFTLRWVKILDNLKPFFKESREFQLRSKISSEAGDGFSQLDSVL